AVRLRNPPVRGRGRGPRGPGAGPRGADAAGDPPDLHSPGAVTVSTSALPRRGQQRGEILDALSVRKGERSGRDLGRIGGITGFLARPSHLILGRYTASGLLRVVGRTAPLPSAVRAQVGTVLTAADESHPWPDRLSIGWGRGPQLYLRIRPLIVVEVTVDVAAEHGRWRHPARFVRLRVDLQPSDVDPPP
ncbi:MAG: dependent ligase, partial [Actinomycetia bacterium]|nr:dependent ligase [Actinomycetes bacterium]